MATKNETARTRTEAIKAALRSTTTCSDTTVAALQELLLRKNDEPVQKENVRAKVQATARRRAGTATAAPDGGKQPTDTLAPRDKYILATEAANMSLKTLADALKNQTSTPASRTSPLPKPIPSDAARTTARSRAGHTKTPSAAQKALKERSVTQTTNSSGKPAALRRSSSYSSFLTPGPDAGLVATAECARVAFAYLGTAEATKVLGKDSKDLQLENGILALVGKLVALGLDNLAVKEMRNLKRRLEKYLGHNTGNPESKTIPAKAESQQSIAADKESLASLLSFGAIEPQSPALPLVASLQTYTLRVIAKLRRPRIIEATWESLQLDNPTSPANLLQQLANSPNGAPKAARQLESLAQTILALCPSISSTSDAATLQPSPAVVLRLQLLAFKIRNRWWALSNHKGNTEQELLEPFAKCVVTFARRSDLPAVEKYNLCESLYKDLAEQLNVAVPSKDNSSGSAALISKTLCSLAQTADLSDEALRWLGPSDTGASSTSSAAKQACRVVRIATVSIEASLKGQDKPELDTSVTNALEALKGSLGGSALELDSLFMEANALRRISTKWLATIISASADDASHLSSRDRATSAIAASIHFSARFVGTGSLADADPRSQNRHEDRVAMAWKCLKSIMESAMTCCKHTLGSSSHWTDLDAILQDCSHILLRLEEGNNQSTIPKTQETELIKTCIVKLSNAYWTVHLQLRKKESDAELALAAMQRSIQLVQKRSPFEKDAAHFTMKLERTGDALENLGRVSAAREALEQCIKSNADAGVFQVVAENAAKYPLQVSFEGEASPAALGRVLKSLHRSYIKHGIKRVDELAFYDDTELQSGVRGALLEWQLGLYSKTMSRSRQWDSNLNKSITTLVERLVDIYAPEKYPVRRMRLFVVLLQLTQSYPHVVSSSIMPQDMSTLDQLTVQGSEDEGLARFEKHLKALHGLKTSMQQTTLPTETLRQCFATWESIVDSVSSWELLTDSLDDVDTWVQDVRASVDCLNAKGEEYLALPVLHLLVKTFELQKVSDASELVLNLCLLGVQFLRLGYTGKAGLALAKAEALIERRSASIDAKLKWHVAYAEYLLRIGNAVKCASLLAAAESIARADSQFMDLAKSTTTVSGRVRFNSILADVCYVYSLLATHNGSLKDAARHAKQCVTLNRRTWAALESKVNARQADSVRSDADTTNGTALDALSSMRNDKGELLVVSNTHDALGGADFWFVVPALYRGLMQHSLVFANQGLFQEAIYVAEQAEKVALATQSPSLMTENASWRAECWAQSGRPDKAETLLKSFDHHPTRRCLSVAGFHSAVARVHHFTGRYEEEIASYSVLESLLKDLTSPLHIKSLDTIEVSIDSLTEKVSNINLDAADVKVAKPSTSARGRKPAVKTTTRATPRATTSTRAKAGASSVPKTASKTQRQSATAEAPEASNVADQCSTLASFQAMVMHRAVLANLLQDDIAQAADTIARIEKTQSGADQDVLHMWAKFKFMLAQSAKQIAEDFAFNTLPESTIAFPAIGIKDRRLSELPPMKRAAPASATTKGGRGKKPTKVDFTETLHAAREGLLEVHALAAARGSNHLFQQVSTALGHVTVLLSAVSGGELRGSLHPLYAAYTSEIPKCNALRLAQESVEADKEQMTRDECLRWPLSEASNFSLTSASEFQKLYVDIIPDSWIAMSLALNEARDELYVTRYEAGLAPFVLRLPLARHASRDMDEEEFSFEDGKASFDELIELSDFSTRTAKDMTSKQARQQWWAEREALDTRLHELLINMENIWLGGFKGVFSQHLRQPTLLARFRKTFENVLNNHLPSRRKKTQAKRAVLDTRVLELFIGLGDVANEDLDLDEELMDLIYFVVDILQFNGEPNAYDEIDFDAMVVETHDALRSYHEASHNSQSSSPHTILILDNNLHAFPWESMPCLEKLSISRLPSLAALRERLLAAKSPAAQQDAAPGHYISAGHGGASILNPSGDLAHTLKTLEPYLDELQGPWDHISSRAPSEKEFENALQHKDLVLYFGHGSGAQFVRSKSVRRLYPGQQAEQDTKPGCATTFLFGCSSVHLTENGIYEPSGMLASYLTAGAPAVLGMLWDVTDKDCDRFAIRAGELWGLWPEGKEDKDTPQSSKTPAKKARGKGKATQVADESGKKGKKGKGSEADVGERRRGAGLDEAVRDARSACVLRYLNGAAAVVYGIPVYLE